MYVFSFESSFYSDIKLTLDKYEKWITLVERYEDDPVIEVAFMFDDSTADELACEIGEHEGFGGYWPLGSRLV